MTNTQVITYVLGLCYSADGSHVCIMKKNRGPADMAGKYNAPGGKIEIDETAEEAMAREFLEETGVHIPAAEWEPVAYKTDKSTFIVTFFRTFTDKVFDCKTIEDEEILVVSLASLKEYNFFDYLDQSIVKLSVKKQD